MAGVEAFDPRDPSPQTWEQEIWDDPNLTSDEKLQRWGDALLERMQRPEQQEGIDTFFKADGETIQKLIQKRRDENGVS